MFFQRVLSVQIKTNKEMTIEFQEYGFLILNRVVKEVSTEKVIFE